MKHGRKESAVAEVRQHFEERNAKADRLIREWSQTEEGTGLDDLYINGEKKTARNTAIALEMQERHLGKLSENIISQNFGVKPEHVLKVVRIGVANSNRGNIFLEYPLMTVDDAIYFIDMTYEQALRGTTAGDKLYESKNQYYAGEARLDSIGTGNGATTNFTGTLSVKPVIPYKVVLLVGGKYVGVDDGEGNIVSTLLTGTNTINYTTGAYDITFSTAPTSGDDISFETHWDSEDSTLYDQYGTVGISVSKKRFQARPMPLGYSFSQMAEVTLGTTGLGDAHDMLIGAVGDAHAQARDYKAVALAKRQALNNAITTFNTDFAAAGELSDKSHAQRVLSVIDDIGGDIYDDINRGKVNRAIAGSRATTYFKKHDLWEKDDSQPRSGVYYAGKLDDIEVYTCPADSNLIANNEVILTYMNPQEGMDLSIVFGVLTELAAELRYPQMYTEGNLATVEDKMVINSKFLRILRLAGI